MLNYIVKAGDTLYTIAQDILGDGSRYMEFLNWNSDITDPNLISEGQVIQYPDPNAANAANPPSSTQAYVVPQSPLVLMSSQAPMVSSQSPEYNMTPKTAGVTLTPAPRTTAAQPGAVAASVAAPAKSSSTMPYVIGGLALAIIATFMIPTKKGSMV